MPSYESRTAFGPDTPDPLIGLGRPIAEACANDFYNILATITNGRYAVTPKLDPGISYVSGPELASTHSDQQNGAMSEEQLMAQAFFLLNVLADEDPEALATITEPVKATDGRSIELRAGNTPDDPVRVRIGVKDILSRCVDTPPQFSTEKRALRSALGLDTDGMSQAKHPRLWLPMGWIIANPGEAMPLHQVHRKLDRQFTHVLQFDPVAPLRR